MRQDASAWNDAVQCVRTEHCGTALSIGASEAIRKSGYQLRLACQSVLYIQFEVFETPVYLKNRGCVLHFFNDG